MKKIFALVMIVSILGAFMAGCSKSDDTSTPAAGAAAGGAAAGGAGAATGK